MTVSQPLKSLGELHISNTSKRIKIMLYYALKQKNTNLYRYTCQGTSIDEVEKKALLVHGIKEEDLDTVVKEDRETIFKQHNWEIVSVGAYIYHFLNSYTSRISHYVEIKNTTETNNTLDTFYYDINTHDLAYNIADAVNTMSFAQDTTLMRSITSIFVEMENYLTDIERSKVFTNAFDKLVKAMSSYAKPVYMVDTEDGINTFVKSIDWKLVLEKSLEFEYEHISFSFSKDDFSIYYIEDQEVGDVIKTKSMVYSVPEKYLEGFTISPPRNLN